MSAPLRSVTTDDDRLVQVLECLDETCRNLANAVATLGSREAHVTSAMKHSRLLNATQVGALLDCDLRTLRRLVRAGSVPKPVHIGTLLRWRMADIEAWLEKKR